VEQFWQKLTAFAFHRTGEFSSEQAVSALSPETTLYLQELVGEPSSNMLLYQTALTHRSLVHDPASVDAVESNQRLEFLGDSVLGLLIADYLFRNFPENAEGELSNTRAKIVNSKSLAEFARSINLGEHILIGESAEHYNIKESESALADAFESIIGAIYLDKGLQKAYDFVIRHIIEQPNFSTIIAEEQNYKSRLIEYTQSHHIQPPLYTVIEETGAEHNKCFTVAVQCNNQVLGTGTARRKKDAEQLAAKEAMKQIGENNVSELDITHSEEIGA